MRFKLLLLLFIHFSSLFGTTSESNEEYDKLLQIMVTNSTPKDSRMSTQSRKDIQKNLLIMDKGERRHFRLNCNRSDIQLLYDKEKKMEIIEQMQQVVCMMQEKPVNQQQMVQILHADFGTYFYQRNLFEAKSVQLFRYLLPQLPLTKLDFTKTSKMQPIMTGNAQTVKLTFNPGTQFTASQIKWSGSL